MAGHSKWANIKHRKGRQDALRGKANTKLIREITVAVKEAGQDPGSNPRLRLAIEKANRANVTKDSIKRAIDKGAGNIEGADYQEVMYEGYAPGGVAMMVSCLTDNKNRTVAEVRHAFSKHNGNLGTDGSVSYLFARKGLIVCENVADLDVLMDLIIDYDVDDVAMIGENVAQVVTSSVDLEAVSKIVDDNGYKILQADISWIADTLLAVGDEDKEKLENLQNTLEDLDDCQDVYMNVDFENS